MPPRLTQQPRVLTSKHVDSPSWVLKGFERLSSKLDSNQDRTFRDPAGSPRHEVPPRIMLEEWDALIGDESVGGLGGFVSMSDGVNERST
eukprot:CAMPEP_0172591836 /NCGR_PEP_ID=MMETSP1068-20121228/10699_1 /TAXON_ID=35684 /ORGANISM="Pseudopedinella elastica, Strain CCMP716" /LENGTH=89 /DNA_ID=CAMNT_0013388529 /DNA_START=545 /DNA_END=815 /DNA_ORIENTATION=+